MEITFEIGENQWNSNGTHICNQQGIVEGYTEQTIVIFDTIEIYQQVLQIVTAERNLKNPPQSIVE